jgi:hypothetical protein
MLRQKKVKTAVILGVVDTATFPLVSSREGLRFKYNVASYVTRLILT